MKRMAYISSCALHVIILLYIGYAIDSNSWNRPAFFIEILVIGINVYCALAEYRKILFGDATPEKKILFQQATVKYFLTASILSICPIALIGINLFFHENRLPFINYASTLAVIVIFEVYNLHIKPLLTKRYLELSDLTEEEADIIRRAVEYRNPGGVYKRVPKPDGIVVIESWIAIFLIILISLLKKEYLLGEFTYSMILSPAILLMIILEIETYYSPKPLPKREKPAGCDYETDVINILLKYRGKGLHVNTRYID